MSSLPLRRRTKRPSWVGAAGVAAWVLVAAWAPSAWAGPLPTEPTAATRGAEAGFLASFQLTSLVLHLVAGVPPTRPARTAEPPPGAGEPMTLLELERRIWAGEEGLPPVPEPP